MLTLYDYLPSQNGYKVRLLFNHLQRPYAAKWVSIFEGEGRRADFLAKSPTGAVPVLELRLCRNPRFPWSPGTRKCPNRHILCRYRTACSRQRVHGYPSRDN